ncbi:MULTISPECIES: endolytic transglycosylase MltG [Bifidobacterium]|uniref:endolytic transglycosylase MltG n=1 Tax=Bifidobacterium TaxID=1678 RepID=UPI001BDC5218|nr:MULTISPECIES: endolytic transglycosylase MltG [Bifidobacterium]MBT1161327.1 endolytic transglycosylase MltG [Bifidobacterium sp. SO1]MBW3078373.1 endolytic transglycosylase MltG [Bifidobacterium simiiventris]
MAEDFENFFSDNTQWVDDKGASMSAAAPPKPPKSRKEMRRRRAQRQQKMVVAVIAAIVVVVLAISGFALCYGKLKTWSATRDTTTIIEDYSGPGTGSVAFTVEQGQGPAEIGENLLSQDIVKSSAAFTSAVASANATLYPGTYQLKHQMKASDVVAVLSDQSKAGGFLEVKPGERVSTVLANVAAIDGVDADDFTSVLTGDGSGILPAEAEGSFEGWLEPGTYTVTNRSASEVVKDMVDARIAKLDSLGVAAADRHRVLTIASIAEAEVNKDEYYGKVTRVIENRLEQDMTLGMDSTVAYGNDVEPSMITQDMLDDASNPYNTRQNKGLPPTPISNPADKAIQAALNPEEGDWLYFVTVNLKTGETKFTTGSLDEQSSQFEQYVNEYKTNNENAN